MTDAAASREQTFDLAGVSLRVTTWGELTAPGRGVLLVHGLTASSREFVDLGPALAAAGWCAIAPDLRGRGRSSKPAHGYGLPFHADDLLALCDRLALQRVHLVGHSLGALIGLYLAALFPARLDRLVMIDAGGRIPEDTQQAIAASVNRLGVVYPSLDAYLDAMRLLPMFRWNAFHEQSFRYDAEVHADGTVTSCVPRSAIEQEAAAVGVIRTEGLPAFVRQPTLVLRAALGTLGPDRGIVLPREEAERLRTVMANCRIVEIPDTNHYTIVESPKCQEAVLGFLAG
ncbi:MAG TPA: alpha/beta hydrolase [Vicinamibacterales bacterium]|jgi:pimeloyl-ACP methyl ester carboxylesterase